MLCRVPGRELCTDGLADSRPCSEDQHCLHLIREDQRPRHWDREAQGYGGRYRGDWLQSKGRVGGRLPGGSGPTGEIWRMSRSYPGEEGGSSITARESGTCKGPEEKGRGESLCTGGGELPGSGWKAPQGWAVQGPASRVRLLSLSHREWRFQRPCTSCAMESRVKAQEQAGKRKVGLCPGKKTWACVMA